VTKGAIGEEPLCEGAVDGIGHAARFHAAGGQRVVLIKSNLGETETHEAALSALLKWLEQEFTANHLCAAGHRVVHGGSRFAAPILIDAAVIASVRELVPFAPLHQPHYIAAIETPARLHQP
jgi:acetate kinase